MVARWFRMIIDVMQASAPALLILAGGYLVVHHDTSIGTVFVFATVLTACVAVYLRAGVARMSVRGPDG